MVFPEIYPKLSRPFESMKLEYDVVVVGSGYGAGVAASRMIRAGKSVAVLELGWERKPGTFPQSLAQCLNELHISGSFTDTRSLKWFPSGSETRLFQLVLGDGQDSFVAHGLGGCSLINAGVFLEADSHTLKSSPWPPEIREDPHGLKTYYTRAARMLQPSHYPLNFPPLRKMQHLEELSKYLSDKPKFYRTPLTTFFNDSRNKAGIAMRANTGAGHECTGMNDGSKNSVATSYLADAWYWGAEIFCGCEVRFLEVGDKGYTIYFSLHGRGRSGFREEFVEQLFWKDFCFLGAGALGTTAILLQSKKRGMAMSPTVGRNLSGNGDLLVFGYNGPVDINGVAGNETLARHRPGPTITSVIDNRSPGRHDSLAGYVVQDGCIPEPLSRLIQIPLLCQSITSWPVRFKPREALAALRSLVLGPYAMGGAIQRTATYLVMSHDSNEMTLSLRDGKIVLCATGEGASENYTRLRGVLAKLLHCSRDELRSCYFLGRAQEEISVHLLGGANMSRDGTGSEGVTNHLGEVFDGRGSDVYKGLVCCDGSIIPTALGVNPLATITAVAERSLALLIAKNSLISDLETENEAIHPWSAPKTPKTHEEIGAARSIGWQFTEVLDGFVSVSPGIDDFAVSESRGKASSCAVKLYLTVELCQQSQNASGWEYQGKCIGTLSCSALSKSTLRISDGEINFFVQDKDRADAKVISYSLPLHSIEGTRHNMHLQKVIDGTISFSLRNAWRATTAANATITDVDGERVGNGILRIYPAQLWRQIGTFRTTEAFNIALIRALLAFLSVFLYNIILFLFRPIVATQEPGGTKSSFAQRQLTHQTHQIKAADGTKVVLQVFEPNPSARATKLAPLLFLPGVTGVGSEYHLMALPFQKCSMVAYFTERGYRCYALTPRWNYDGKVAEECTIFDCSLDVAAAVNHILTVEQRKPYIVAHCQGSVALCMALLSGAISSAQILGITANSVFMNQVFGYWNALKGRSTFLIRLWEAVEGSFYSVSSGGNKLSYRILDRLLRIYPVQHRRDLCSSVSCHRTSFAFGLLWNHENLSRNIHDNIHRFFAGTHTHLLKHVVRMGTRGICLDDKLRSLATPENLERLRGVPILFISGTDNDVFKPESTLRDYELLRRRFGEGMYRRFLVEGYGHLDPIIGKNADDDVFWRIHGHLNWCSKHEADNECT